MAKPTTYAAIICTVLTIILAIGIIIGLIKTSPIIIIISLLPTVIYEAYRTEGKSTRWASWVMLFIIIAEIVMIVFKLKFDLAQFLGVSGKYVAGFYVPFGDLKVIFPSVMAVLAVILFVRTAGIYTRWLAVLIIIGAFAAIYTIDVAIFQQLIKLGINQGLNRLNW